MQARRARAAAGAASGGAAGAASGGAAGAPSGWAAGASCLAPTAMMAVARRRKEARASRRSGAKTAYGYTPLVSELDLAGLSWADLDSPALHRRSPSPRRLQ